jgi:phosphopentomutase
MDGVEKTLQYMKESFEGILFTNLVDFDMLYGHRNDIEGYAKALIEFDDRVTEILECLKDDDILFITADHGCDPSTESTDHSREYVPLIAYGKKLKKGINLGTRSTFADIAQTVAHYLGIDAGFKGTSFLEQIL